MFHRAICTNQFLHKIGRIDSPNCYFCKKYPETLFHLFCECEKVTPLWDDLCFLINTISGESFDFSNVENMFGLTDSSEHDCCISFLFLCLKFYIHRCKFQESIPNFVAFMNLVKMKRSTEYKIAESKGKLSLHFKNGPLILKLLRPCYFFFIIFVWFLYNMFPVPCTIDTSWVCGDWWECVRGCLVFGVCHVLSWCLSCFVMFVASCLCVDFFFETDHAVHGLSQIALCVYSRGRVGFFWGGGLLLWKKIWVCCHVQVYVQLYDALIYISMPAWLYFPFWFILGLTTFGYSVMAVLIFWLFLLGLVHSLPSFLHNFAWSWLLLPLSQW